MCTYLLICFNSLTALNEAFEANVEFLIFNFVLLHLEPRAGADFGFGASKDRSRPKKARLRNKRNKPIPINSGAGHNISYGDSTPRTFFVSKL